MKIVLLACILAISATAAQAQSLWDHNGSVMSLMASGAHRQFYYSQPRPGMVQSGVRPGTLYFDGVTDGRQYSGTAYVFSTKCGATGFPASGPVSPNGGQVVLYGQSPIINAWNCTIMGYHDSPDKLEFALIAPAPAPVQPVQVAPPPQQPPQNNNNNNVTINNQPNINITVPPPIILNNNNNLTPNQ
jgi:hypothetical protein